MTNVGKAVAIEAEAAVRAYDSIATSTMFGDNFSGELKLGAVPTTLTGLMPMAVHLLKRRYPDLKVLIYPALSRSLINQIDRGSIDAGIIGKPELMPNGLNCNIIASEPMQLLAPPKTKVDDPMVLLRTFPFIRFNREALFGQLVEKWLQKKGIRVSETMELDGLEAIASMVFANLGISIVPESCVRGASPIPIKRLSLGEDAPARELGLAFSENNPKADVIKQVLIALLDAKKIGKLQP